MPTSPHDTQSNVFREELAAHIPQVRAFARFLCRHDSASADDLAQTALLRAWAAQKTYRLGSNMRAWLFRIVRNCHLSERRRAWRVAGFDAVAGERALQQAPAQPALLDLEDVRRALATLPQDQQEALILFAAAGMTYEEIAAICGCAVGTVKSRINRGRLALTAALDPPFLASNGSADPDLRATVRRVI